MGLKPINPSIGYLSSVSICGEVELNKRELNSQSPSMEKKPMRDLPSGEIVIAAVHMAKFSPLEVPHQYQLNSQSLSIEKKPTRDLPSCEIVIAAVHLAKFSSLEVPHQISWRLSPQQSNFSHATPTQNTQVIFKIQNKPHFHMHV